MAAVGAALRLYVFWMSLFGRNSDLEVNLVTMGSRAARMSILIPPTELSTLRRRGPWFFFGGLALFVGGLATHSYLTMSGLLAIMVGASIIGLVRGVVIRGMWLLSALLLFISAF